MPDYFTHKIAATEILTLCGREIKDKISNTDLYFLGAQGGDLFFFYGLSYKNNLGRMLHRISPMELFLKLKEGNPSYEAGWATHYALDSCVHPYVYAYQAVHRGAFTHINYERDLGLYVSRKTGIRRSILPRERVLACTTAVCDGIRKAVPEVSVSGTENCLARHFLYTKNIFKNKGGEFKLNGDYGAAFLGYEAGVKLGVRAVTCVLQGEIDGDIFNRQFLQK